MGGNRFTVEPTMTRDSPIKPLRLPAEKLEAFQAAATMEGLSFNAWMIEAGDAHLKGSSRRAAKPEAVERRLRIAERRQKKEPLPPRGSKPRRKEP